MGNSLCRCYCCCFKCESTPSACRMDLCCCHLGGGHLGAGHHPNEVGETVIRREKANIDLCCCGLKVNDVDVASHPATRPTGPTSATTKPAGAPPSGAPGAAPVQQNAYNPPPPVGYGNGDNVQQQSSGAATSTAAGAQQPVMGYPAVQKKAVD